MRKTRIGLTRDLFDAEGKFMAPGLGLGLLEDMPDIEYGVFAEHLPEVTPQQIDGYDMVVSLLPRWTADSLKGNDRLLAVLRWGVGYDMVDVPALTKAGVAVFVTADAVRRPVAVCVLTFLLALSTKLLVKDRLTREGRWQDRAKHLGIGLVGRTLGLIGVGNIGHEVFRLAMPLDMRHIACDPYVRPQDLSDVNVELLDMDTVLAEADFLSLCCPLNETTYHLIGERELRKMKPSSFLINTSRGAVVDETALTHALSEGWIQGAGIDVFEQEPTPVNNPLLKQDNIIVTPHALNWMDQTLNGVWDCILEQMNTLRRGKFSSGLLNRDVWNTSQFEQKLKKFLEEVA